MANIEDDADGQPQNPISVLIVDDDANICALVKVALKGLGFDDVETATEGLTAYSMMCQKRYSLVICDISMTPFSGWDLLKAIRGKPDWVNIPFIFLTGNTNPETAELAMDKGANFYITKPFSKEKLKDALMKARPTSR